MAKPPRVKRFMKLGSWNLPTRAVRGLLDNGIDETNIGQYEISELETYPGFGKMAASSLREQRAKVVVSKKQASVTRDLNRADAKQVENIVSGSLSFLDISPREGPRGFVSKTMRVQGDRLILDIGPEHGIGGRHLEWMERIVQSLVHMPEVGVDSLERLVVKLIRGAKANDPTNGGLNSVSIVTEGGIEESLSPVLRV